MDAPITPIPIPPAEFARLRAVLLIGGSFDPPHLGHTRVAAALRAAAFPDGPCAGHVWLVYVPAARSPHKPVGPVASDADRVAMLGLALASIPQACVWTDELDRAPSEPSYTVDTVRRARAWLDGAGAPGVPLRLVIGTDQAAAFHRWRDPRDIIALAEPLVMARAGVIDGAAILRSLLASGAWSPADLAAWRERVIDLKSHGLAASSTDVRAKLARGDALIPELDPAVAAYITRRGLYAGS